MKTVVHLKIAFVLCSLLLSLPSRAESSYDLLYEREWPTASDLEEHMDWPSYNPFIPANFGRAEKLINFMSEKLAIFKRNLPSVIAGSEYLFPGATLVAMGRDAFLLGDAIDYFYMGLGQKGRVVRLKVSGSSFSRKSFDLLAQHLRTNGLETKSEKQLKTDPPFVLIDGSDYNADSQCVAYLTAGFKAMMRSGIDPLLAVSKFGFLTGYRSGQVIFSGIHRQRLKEKNSQEIKELFAKGAPSYPALFFRLSKYPEQITHPGVAWHSEFQKLNRMTIEGRIFAVAPTPKISIKNDQKTAEHREYILALNFEIRKLVRSPEFLQSVMDEAALLGYKFPTKQKFSPTHATRQNQSLKKINQALGQDEPFLQFKASSLKSMPDDSLVQLMNQWQKSPQTTTSKQIVKSLNSWVDKHFFPERFQEPSSLVHYLKSIIELQNMKMISFKEFWSCFEKVFPFIINDHTIIQTLSTELSQNENFRRDWQKLREVIFDVQNTSRSYFLFIEKQLQKMEAIGACGGTFQ